MKNSFDVIIIGGGVVGSAIARELSKYKLSAAVLEKDLDVVNETSGRNSAVVHGGFAYDTGTLKSKLCLKGNRGMTELSKQLNFKFNRCGKVLVGNTKEDMASLERTLAQGKRNGVEGLCIIDDAKLHKLVPAVAGKFAMFSPNSGILDPFGYTIALAENAAQNGVHYFFDNEVTAIQYKNKEYIITTKNSTFTARWVINSAGLGCGAISDMLGIKGYKIIGSKGDYIILDKNTGALLPMPVYPVPSNTYMGIHVTNTTGGNVIIGPNAETASDFNYYGVPQKNIDYLASDAAKLWPYINRSDFIRNYSGILSKCVDDNGVIQDFRIEIRDDIAPNAVNLIGIESPGLTAAVPIAEMVLDLMKDREKFAENEKFNPCRAGIKRFADATDTEREELIKQNPDYGELVCRCEKVSRAEIIQAIHNPLNVHTITGIKYRTRGMMGRCQGGYCQMRITQMIQDECSLKEQDILYERQGSNIFIGKLRDGE